MASSIVSKGSNIYLRGDGYRIEHIPYHKNGNGILPEGPKKFNRMNSREGLPTSFQRNQSNHKMDPDELEEIENLFNKKFAFKPPEPGWKLPDVEKMFVSEKWKDDDMMAMKDELNGVKNKLNDYDMYSWHRHTKAMNKAGNVMKTVKNVVNGEFVTQAWCKFYEICDSYKLVSNLAQEENSLNSLHLCEAPGAFITSLNHYLQLNHPNLPWKWISTTLNPYYEGNPLPKMINDDRFILHTLDKWKFGEDYTGNIMDLANMRSLVRECQELGPILLVTADGSIDCSNDPGEQESIVRQLFFCEIVTALHALSGGGNFVVKMFTMYEADTICLMYLLVCCFESVSVYKPATSKEGNSENYVVCLNYEGTESLKPWLKKLCTKISSDEFKEAMFSLEDISSDFMQQLKECAKIFKNNQTEVIERNIFVYQSQNQPSIKKMKRLSYAVANEYLRRYRLTCISEDRQIVGENILRETEMPNMDAKEAVGSFNDFLEKQKIRGYDRLKLLADDMRGMQIQWKHEDDIKWLEFQKYSNKFKIVFGKPVTSVLCSKFCLGKVLTMRNDIAELAKELNYVGRPPKSSGTDSDALYSEKLSCEIEKIIEKHNPNLLKNLKVLNYKEKLWVSLESGMNESFERTAFFDIMDLVDSLWRDQNFVLQGYPMLTQFTAGVIYMIGHLFEKVGFVRPVGQDFAVIFQNYRSLNMKMKNFLKELDSEIENLEDNKSVLAVIPLTDIIYNHKEFYTTVTSVNSLCVQEQNRVVISEMMEKCENK